MTATRSMMLLAAALAALLVSCELFRSAQPVPQDKREFVGVWRSASGFVLRVKAGGTAAIAQIPDTAHPDAGALNIKVAPPVINDLRVEFHGDSTMLLITPLLYAREYRVDRAPYLDGDTTKMTLNGVTLIRR